MEWVLAFPRAPTGSVSIQIWSLACAGAVGLVWEAGMGAWGLLSSSGDGVAMKNEKRVPVAFEAGQQPEGKKEL